MRKKSTEPPRPGAARTTPPRPSFSFRRIGFVLIALLPLAGAAWWLQRNPAAAPPARSAGTTLLKPDLALPPPGEVVPLEQIEKICAHYGLAELWDKIRRDPPARPFSSDGCSHWINETQGVSLYPACFLHDLKYWAGYPGEEVERLAADAELMLHVARLTHSPKMGEVMFHGVRVGGGEELRAAFSWGFGRRP